MAEDSSEKLPLFPLGRPLYPGVTMRLRIFEQRYLKLVRDSMRTGVPFGIVPIISGHEVGKIPDYYKWGTLVSITDFYQQPDGLLGISISGNRRFSVLDHSVQDDGLILADVEALEEEPTEPCGPGERDLKNLLDDLVQELSVDDLFPEKEPSLAELSWRLATILPLPPAIRMSLLKESDPFIRLDIIRECLVDLTGNENSVN